MGKTFANILALIDSSDDCDPRFRAAIELANLLDANLYVLCRNREGCFYESGDRDDYPFVRVWTLKDAFKPVLRSKLQMHIHIMKDQSRKNVLSYKRKHNIDLVLVWRSGASVLSTTKALIRSNGLVQQLDCAVLSMPQNSGMPVLKNIILPVEQPFPVGKMLVAIRLARKFNANLHLVGGKNGKSAINDDHLFDRVCQLLRNNANIKVECQQLKDMNVVQATIKYGRMVNADLILSCTGRRSLVRSIACLLLTRPAAFVKGVPLLTVPAERMAIE